ncbi:hypothetical protein QBC37DRAFT_400775 [Rhypophila decipiens]|uniref:Uncharacterized protein n=1 Tax=Rhypophila decipiens TaxID=261697 RepID=A0AAN7B730_9PEZI|nr:hypothetical protein QBC37DRAFT_400775 [Rhypophila decipiens]
MFQFPSECPGAELPHSYLETENHPDNELRDEAMRGWQLDSINVGHGVWSSGRDMLIITVGVLILMSKLYGSMAGIAVIFKASLTLRCSSGPDPEGQREKRRIGKLREHHQGRSARPVSKVKIRNLLQTGSGCGCLLKAMAAESWHCVMTNTCQKHGQKRHNLITYKARTDESQNQPLMRRQSFRFSDAVLILTVVGHDSHMSSTCVSNAENYDIGR